MTFWTAIFGIVLVCCVAAVLNNYLRARARGDDKRGNSRLEDTNRRLDEIGERVATLERILTDRQSHLRREFEELDR